MITLLYCLRRLPSLTLDQFHAYWSGPHADLVARLGPQLGVIKYVQHHAVQPEATELARQGRGLAEPFDGIAAITFTDWASVELGNLSPESAAAHAELAADEARFIDQSRSSMIFTKSVEFPEITALALEPK